MKKKNDNNKIERGRKEECKKFPIRQKQKEKKIKNNDCKSPMQK